MTLYRIKDWNDHFENNKSREVERCRFLCLPNKQHGMGFRRIMSEPDGAAIYGVWVSICAACSQQKAPRSGWLTEDGKRTGTPWEPTDIALKIGRPEAEIERCLAVTASARVGWLDAVHVSSACRPTTDEPPERYHPTTLEQNRTEGTERTEQKTYVELASEILKHLNEKASREFRHTTDNLKLIARRIEEVDSDIDGIKTMIDRQCAKWKADPKMSEFLRPETLFGKTKFSGYYDMRDVPVQNGDPSRQLADHSKGFSDRLEEQTE